MWTVSVALRPPGPWRQDRVGGRDLVLRPVVGEVETSGARLFVAHPAECEELDLLIAFEPDASSLKRRVRCDDTVVVEESVGWEALDVPEPILSRLGATSEQLQPGDESAGRDSCSSVLAPEQREGELPETPLVIAQHDRRPTFGVHRAGDAQTAQAVGTPVDEVADEHDVQALGRLEDVCLNLGATELQQ